MAIELWRKGVEGEDERIVGVDFSCLHCAPRLRRWEVVTHAAVDEAKDAGPIEDLARELNHSRIVAQNIVVDDGRDRA